MAMVNSYEAVNVRQQLFPGLDLHGVTTFMGERGGSRNTKLRVAGFVRSVYGRPRAIGFRLPDVTSLR